MPWIHDPERDKGYQEVIRRYAKGFSALYDAAGRGRVKRLPLTAEAAETFETWRVDYLHKAQLRWPDGMPGYVSKAPGSLLRLAGICALVERLGAIPPAVTPAHLAQALPLLDYFHAHRELVERDSVQPVPELLSRTLAQHIVDTGMKELDLFHLRRHTRLSGIRTEAALRQALLELEQARWLAPGTYIPRRSDEPLPRVVAINPGVHRADPIS
jgi:hypothetical protein